MSKNWYKKIFFRKEYTYITVIFLIFLSTFFFCTKQLIEKHLRKKISYLSQSIEYEKIVKKIDMKKLNTLVEANDFIIKNNNIYGALTAIFLAKKFVLNEQLDKALIPLNNSLKYSTEENLKHLLLFKIAKIKQEQRKNKDAIDILKKIKDHNWDSIIENTKGDIFRIMNQKKAAIKSWNNSKLNEDSNASKVIINMKIQDLKTE